MWYIANWLSTPSLIRTLMSPLDVYINIYIYMWCVRYTMYHVRSYDPIATHTMALPMEGGVQIVSWSVVRPYAIFLSFLLAPFVVTYDVGTYGNLRWTIVLWIRRRGTRSDSVEADGCLCSFRFPERETLCCMNGEQRIEVLLSLVCDICLSSFPRCCLTAKLLSLS